MTAPWPTTARPTTTTVTPSGTGMARFNSLAVRGALGGGWCLQPGPTGGHGLLGQSNEWAAAWACALSHVPRWDHHRASQRRWGPPVPVATNGFWLISGSFTTNGTHPRAPAEEGKVTLRRGGSTPFHSNNKRLQRT